MTFQDNTRHRALTRTAAAFGAISVALWEDETLRRLEHDYAAKRTGALANRAEAITQARAEGVSLAELARAFGKSIEWVRQAEMKGALLAAASGCPL